jgi:hypothetical protein
VKIILALIKESKTAFSTTPKDLADLKKSVKKQGNGQKWERKSKGILLWFDRGRVNKIVVFRPY